MVFAPHLDCDELRQDEVFHQLLDQDQRYQPLVSTAIELGLTHHDLYLLDHWQRMKIELWTRWSLLLVPHLARLSHAGASLRFAHVPRIRIYPLSMRYRSGIPFVHVPRIRIYSLSIGYRPGIPRVLDGALEP